MVKRIRSPAFQALLLLVINSLFFGLSDPLRVSSVMLIVAVGLIALTLFWTLSEATKVLHRSFGLQHTRKPVIGLTLLIAGLMALQSVNQLSVRDIIIVLPFAAITYFYTVYGQSAQQQ